MRVIARDPHQLEAAGYPSLVHVPFLIHEDGTYPDEANRYIRVRSLCEWQLRMGNESQPSRSGRRFLTAQTAHAVAWRIGAFLDWCEETKRDWRKACYFDDLIMAWQPKLLSGEASKSGKPLSHDAANVLISEACYFLTWAGDPLRGLREPFNVVTNSFSVSTSKGTSANGDRKRNVESRVGALAPTRAQFFLPTPEEVGIWMLGMRSRYPVKALMAELILVTGIRLSECCEWRIDTLPPKEQWTIHDGKVTVVLRHGIKGPKVTPGSTLSARPRDIEIPIELALRINHYATVTRPTQLLRWTKSDKTPEGRTKRIRAQKPIHLWLSEFSNQPFDKNQLYNAWTTAPGCPRGWHPHRGRHFFAVETVAEWLRNDLASKRQSDVPEMSWLSAIARDQISLILAPKMGHVSAETTLLYLKAAHSRLVKEYGHPAIRWQSFCDLASD